MVQRVISPSEIQGTFCISQYVFKSLGKANILIFSLRPKREGMIKPLILFISNFMFSVLIAGGVE